MSKYIYGITAVEIMSIFVCVILLCYCIFEKREKEKTRRDIIATLPYIIFPCIAAAINTIDPEFSYAYPSVV